MEQGKLDYKNYHNVFLKHISFPLDFLSFRPSARELLYLTCRSYGIYAQILSVRGPFFASSTILRCHGGVAEQCDGLQRVNFSGDAYNF